MSMIRSFRLSAINRSVLFGLFLLPGFAIAQSAGSDTTATDKPETSIELIYTEANNQSKILTTTVKTKVDGTYKGINGISINYYQKEIAPENLLGNATSNDKGVAVLVVPTEKMSGADYTFIAAIENNPAYEDNQEEITASESDFEMTLATEDSMHQVHIKLQAPDATGKLVPVPETEVRLYVQRLFGLLPLSEDAEKTDENGEITAEFPVGIPGDTAGNLIVVAKIEEHEKYGNLEFQRKIDWGTPLFIDHAKHIRELWSSRANAPIYLIVFINAMLIGIWSVIAYIVYEVFLIKKIGQRNVH